MSRVSRALLLAVVVLALGAVEAGGAPPRMHAIPTPPVTHNRAPGLSLGLALKATRYMLRSNEQIGARWSTAARRRIIFDRRISSTRIRFLFELPGIEGAATVRTWPNREISVYLRW